MRTCEIVYVKQNDGNGWKWRPIISGGHGEASEETYELFYECVVAARESGYSPAQELKCR